MPKRTFGLLDVAASVRDVQRSCVGYRAANVYDIDLKTYLFKLQKKDKPKQVLLMESGVRFHVTDFVRDKSDSPSHFSMKLRKHIRTRVLSSVTQLGNDRVVDFGFGQGEACYHIILEMYAKGNMVLTDYQYNILGLLRSHTYDEETKVAVGQVYPIANGKVVRGKEGEAGSGAIPEEVVLSFERWINESRQAALAPPPSTSDNKRPPKKKKLSLKQLLLKPNCPIEAGSYGPVIVEDCLRKAGIDGTMSVAGEWPGLAQEDTKRLLAALLNVPTFINKLRAAPVEDCPGYISYHCIKGTVQTASSIKNVLDPSSAEQADGSEEATDIEVYDEFFPVVLGQHKTCKIKKFPTFNQAVDDFYSKIEGQKAAKRHNIAQSAAKLKLVKMREQQEARILQLQKQEKDSAMKAQAIEANSENIEKARLVVNSALANGVDWDELKDIVSAEQDKENPIATMIAHLKLDKNSIALKLPTWDEGGNMIVVVADIDVSLTAHKNATVYFEKKKVLSKKMEKAMQAAESFLSTAEATVEKELKRAENKLQATIIKQARKVYWFEKFDWFISSENYMVVFGRDAQQNEQLVKRYLRKGDVYVHADVHGASSCIIRNNDMKRMIPQQTLEEAGHMCMCRSSAWKARTISSAWWVYHHQVSKTAPSGEYLTTGSFMIRGKKNFLRPSRLECGFGLLFRVADECVENHANERKIKCDINELGALNFSAIEEEADDNAPVLRRFERKILRKEEEAEKEAMEAAEQALEDAEIGAREEPGDEAEASPKDSTADEPPAPEAPTPGIAPTTEPSAEKAPVSTSEARKKSTGISRHQRKVMRGQRQKKKAGNGDNSDDGEKVESAPSKKKPKAAKQHNLPRGKKGKLKKMKKKYKYQDEEERRLRMAMLGNPMPEKPKETADEGDQSTSSKPEGGSNSGHLKGRKKGNFRQKDHQQQHVLQDAIDVPDELLSALTARPKADDVLLFCLPVCAPYSTMNKYKYRIKLTPGSQKRGASTKVAREFFLKKVADSTKRETELIRGATDAEMIAAILSHVKISTPGVGKLAANNKRAKKKQKQKGGKKKR